MFGRATPFGWTALTLSCLAVLPFWVGEYMPLVDLPQHAAQLSIAQHWDEPAFGYRESYQVNWYSSQLLAYMLTRLFGLVLPLTYAIKVVLTLSVLGFWAATYWMLRTTKSDPWWSLLVLPLGFGFNMYWGLLHYVVAIPLGIVLITLSIRYALAPSGRRALWVTLCANGLFLVHSLVLAYAGLVSVAVVVFKAPRWRDRLLGCLALASVLPTVVLWWTVQAKQPSTADTLLDIGVGPERIWQLFAMQTSGVTSQMTIAVLVGAVLFALPFALGARFTRDAWRWVPFVVSLGVFALAPRAALDIDLIYCRFAVFVLPAWLCALDPGPVGTWQRIGVFGVVAAQLLSLVWAFAQFDREAQPLNQMLAKTLPHKRLLYMPWNSWTDFFPHEAYAHFGGWYQVKKGGIADYSFAELYPAWYRYKPSLEPSLPAEFDTHADHFRYFEHNGDRYDYFLVRGDLVPEWFEGAEQHVTKLASAGIWTLFGRVDDARAARSTP